MNSDFLTTTEYARQEGITLGATYKRIWERRVAAERVLGRWLIEPPEKKPAVGLQDLVSGLPTGEPQGHRG